MIKRAMLCFGLMSLLPGQPPVDLPLITLNPALATQPVGDDADDPAFWFNAKNPSGSLIIGTNKTAAPKGALVVFNMQGKIVQTVSGIDRPNNVDVEYGFRLGRRSVDIAVTTERRQSRLRVFEITSRGLRDISDPEGLKVFGNEKGEQAQPMGIAIYRRPRDGAQFAVVSRKTGPSGTYLAQYRLMSNGKGKVKAVEVRRFGKFSGKSEIEAVVVDDVMGYVYYADEGFGIRKYFADPDRNSNQELALFGTTGYQGDHEGLAIYRASAGSGYLISTDQIDGNSRYFVYSLIGPNSAPHAHELLAILEGGADSTDGIEVVSPPKTPPTFKRGMLIAMNSKPRNFLVYDWAPIENLLPKKK